MAVLKNTVSHGDMDYPLNKASPIPTGVGNIRIVAFEPAHLSEILDLETELWGSSRALNTAYWYWLYNSNPQGNRPQIYVALAEDRVVGAMGFSCSKWHVGQPPAAFNALEVGGVVVDPAFRGRGIARSLYLHAGRNITGGDAAYAFSFSSLATTQHITTNHAGWHPVGAYGTLCRTVGRDRVLAALDGWLYRTASRVPGAWRLAGNNFFSRIGGRRGLAAAARRFPAGTRIGTKGPVTVEDAPRPAAMAELIRRIETDGRIARVRDETYFAWRFANPRCRFRFLFIGEDHLDGYIALQANLDGRQSDTIIADWEATDEATARELIRAAAGCASSTRLLLWSACLSPDQQRAAADAGFVLIDDSGGNKGYRPGWLILPLTKDGTTAGSGFPGVDPTSPDAWKFHLASVNTL